MLMPVRETLATALALPLLHDPQGEIKALPRSFGLNPMASLPLSGQSDKPLQFSDLRTRMGELWTMSDVVLHPAKSP